ncbi:MAG: anti-sigma factor [bacterium]
MKIFLLVILIFLAAGCDLVKPLPGNENITIGKEGIGIDKLADKFIEKVKSLKNSINNLKETGEFLADKQKEFDLTVEKEYADLVDASDNGGSGKAERSYIGGQFTFEMTAELPFPKDNYFYECWLAINEPITYISAGKLVKETDGKYHLKLIVNNDYTNYSNVAVTLETDDNNSAPAATILQGEFAE